MTRGQFENYAQYAVTHAPRYSDIRWDGTTLSVYSKVCPECAPLATLCWLELYQTLQWLYTVPSPWSGISDRGIREFERCAKWDISKEMGLEFLLEANHHS